MKKKKDLRVLRTNKMIMSAFIGLLRNKTYDKITISEIADEAMINRATFYAHFQDKQDLYEKLIEYFLKDMARLLDEEKVIEGENVNIREIEIVLAKFFQFIKEKPEVAQVVIDSTNEDFLLNKLMDNFKERYNDIFKKLEVRENDIIVPTEFIAYYISGIFISTLKWWIKNPDAMKPVDLSHLVIKLISNGHLTVLGVNINREE
ncbi:TetR/AcrR family transcriptional regulator [Floricoccus penangensis]|uniref:TetR/AcrR family transcriptional regulator n=1 Tax=Floricoccus penangensis TaxID=1859475 RepID=UPI00203B75E4|nr:TetR/AcrR family transcriptional regulator [Floricoccus penangensis]URZ86610.1 TetR/AcrR family transcriptional regulator [Floricoccus penangensis]